MRWASILLQLVSRDTTGLTSGEGTRGSQTAAAGVEAHHTPTRCGHIWFLNSCYDARRSSALT